MSGISSASGYTSSLYWSQYQATSTSNTRSVGMSGRSGPPPVPDFTSALEAVGVESSEADELQEQLKSAISSAIAEAEESGGTTDLRDVIRNAIDETLKANGIDPEAVEEQMQPPMGGPGGMPPPPPPEDSTSSDSNTLLSILNSVTDDTSSSGSTITSSLEELMQSLQSLLSQLGCEQGTSGTTVGFLLDVRC